MITITTASVNNRSNWYLATAQVNGYYYHANEKTRVGALTAILRQLAVKGYIKM